MFTKSNHEPKKIEGFLNWMFKTFENDKKRERNRTCTNTESKKIDLILPIFHFGARNTKYSCLFRSAKDVLPECNSCQWVIDLRGNEHGIQLSQNHVVYTRVFDWSFLRWEKHSNWLRLYIHEGKYFVVDTKTERSGHLGIIWRFQRMFGYLNEQPRFVDGCEGLKSGWKKNAVEGLNANIHLT